tara:strand:+ start:10141 stop:11454 length:1314 start_codon:yes stop_codon:yes gene_type:complete
MFRTITEKFDSILKNLRGLGKITDENIESTVRQIRRAMLEADVNFIVVKDFISKIKLEAQGTKVLKSIKPGEQFISIIHENLIKLLGQDSNGLNLSSKFSVILLVGMQGSGKTTTAVKLANTLNSSGKKIQLIAADTYRPGAVEQLKQLCEKIKVPVYYDKSNDPIKIVNQGLKYAKVNKLDLVIIDTAGRLQTDEEMINEIKHIHEISKPDETIYIADSMMGQDIISSAEIFNKSIKITGSIITKLDGDSKGGAAVSIRKVTGIPIKYIGVSEDINGLELFSPKKIVDRILGFGDINKLIAKVERVTTEQDIQKIEEKISSNRFDLNDFRDQLVQFQKMGSFSDFFSMIPGIGSKIKGLNIDDRQFLWTEAMINSMTPLERANPELINGSRRKRIARGSARSIQELNTLLKKFSEMKKLLKKMKKKQIMFPNMKQF